MNFFESALVVFFFLVGTVVAICGLVAPIEYFVKNRLPFTDTCRSGYEAVTTTVYYQSKHLGLLGPMTGKKCVKI